MGGQKTSMADRYIKRNAEQLTGDSCKAIAKFYGIRYPADAMILDATTKAVLWLIEKQGYRIVVIATQIKAAQTRPESALEVA